MLKFTSINRGEFTFFKLFFTQSIAYFTNLVYNILI